MRVLLIAPLLASARHASLAQTRDPPSGGPCWGPCVQITDGTAGDGVTPPLNSEENCRAHEGDTSDDFLAFCNPHNGCVNGDGSAKWYRDWDTLTHGIQTDLYVDGRTQCKYWTNKVAHPTENFCHVGNTHFEYLRRCCAGDCTPAGVPIELQTVPYWGKLGMEDPSKGEKDKSGYPKYPQWYIDMADEAGENP